MTIKDSQRTIHHAGTKDLKSANQTDPRSAQPLELENNNMTQKKHKDIYKDLYKDMVLLLELTVAIKQICKIVKDLDEIEPIIQDIPLSKRISFNRSRESLRSSITSLEEAVRGISFLECRAELPFDIDNLSPHSNRFGLDWL